MSKRRHKKKGTRSPAGVAEVRKGAPGPSKLRSWPAYGMAGVLVVAVAVFTVWWWTHRETEFPAELVHGAASGSNVLLITVDTTRADHLGCYGRRRAETPVLDQLSAEGIRFADAITPVPITLPAHSTIHTGLNPPNHGVRHNAEFSLSPDHVTLAEVLREHGYATAAFTAAFVLDARFGLAQGFDHYDDAVETAAYETFARDINERPAGAVTDAAISWIKQRVRERPFFMWVHYFDPHRPYEAPATFTARFPNDPYDAEIAYMDHEIGRLLGTVEAQGLTKQTIVIVAGDHGEGLGEHGELSHARLIYESVMHVPLILSCPGLSHGSHVVDDVVVSLTDVAPTVLDLLGLEGMPDGDGISLLAARHRTDRVVYMECLATYLGNGWAPLYGLRRHQDKYILAPRPEYYDLRGDPHELENLYEQVTGDALASREVLRTDLAERLAEWPSLAGVVAGAQRLEPETIRRLESLGYVGSIGGDGTEENLPDPKDMIDVMEAVDQANALARAGERAQALAVIDKAAAKSPHDPRVLETKGKILLHAGREAEAESVFLDCLAAKPNANVCLLLAQIFIKDRRYEEASMLLKQGLELEPRHGGLYIALGDLLGMTSRSREALAAYGKAIEVDPYRASGAARARIEGIKKIMKDHGIQ